MFQSSRQCCPALIGNGRIPKTNVLVTDTASQLSRSVCGFRSQAKCKAFEKAERVARGSTAKEKATVRYATIPTSGLQKMGRESGTSSSKVYVLAPLLVLVT